MVGLKATWQKVTDKDILQRSSHICSVVRNAAYIFGGELQPREPRDNDVHIVEVQEGGFEIDYFNPLPDQILLQTVKIANR